MKRIGLLGGMCWESSAVPVFDTTRLHAQRAAELALSNHEGKAHP